jgi:uncharacterized protein YjbJ (UPF0337 family)
MVDRIVHVSTSQDCRSATHPTRQATFTSVRCKKEQTEEARMSGDTKKVKGRAKQAIGAITGDKELQQEGRSDERVGDLENKIDDVTDAVNDKLDEVIEKASRKK